MFWLVLTLNQNYDKEIHIPIKIVNVPQNVVITQNITHTLDITVRDKGFALLGYNLLISISINMLIKQQA